ncbi:adenosine kinase [Prolixibacteraceae bacterium JC049]|nr:adenosine kinase [Prolixibacteraceae bacterium JC049]
MNDPKAPSILGIGNALVDIMIQLDSDDRLNILQLPKGGMTLVDAEKSQAIDESTEGLKKEISSGGSVANTCFGLGKLGMKVGYLGKVGNDSMGEFYKNELVDANVTPVMLEGSLPTGKAMALISKDGERTFGTYLGSAVEMQAEELTNEMFDGYDYFHIEGYLVQNHALIEQAAKLAKEQGLKVAIDLASYNVVEANLDFLRGLLENYVDIVFANEEEAKAISGLEPEEALHWIAERSEMAVVKLGKDGSLVKYEGKVYRADAEVRNCIDTTGAGDLFAAGFFYGLMNNIALDKCAQIGALTGGTVVEIIGARVSDELWQDIKQKIEEIKA